MAKHGINGIIGGGVAEGGVMDATMEDYRAALVRAGRPDAQLGEDLSVGFHFYLAETVEKGIKESAKFYEENVKMFGPLRLHRGLSEQQMVDIADPRRAPNAGLPTLEDAVNNGAVLCGPPDRIIEQLNAVAERYPGLDRVGVSHPVGTPQSVIIEQLEWFAKDVMPAFKGKVEVTVPAD